MQRLVTEGAAASVSATVDSDDITVLRLGAPPTAAGHAPVQVGGSDALPAWLSEPAQAETGRMILSPSRLSPSSEPPVLSPLGPGRTERLRRGRLIHTLFEVLPGIDPSRRRGSAATFLRSQPDLTPDQRSEIEASVFGVLDDPQFAAVFGPGGRPEAPVIGALGSDRIINGRVDRLVVTDDEILLADYKTDRPAPPSAETVAEAYLAQLAAYREVLSRRWPGRRVRCVLVWTDGPKLMEIPSGLLQEALSRLL
jgi:ATP-dependent helicase/nuclease subunit A